MNEQYYLDLIERLLNGAQYSGDDSLCDFCDCRLPWDIHQPKEHEPDCPYVEAKALLERMVSVNMSDTITIDGREFAIIDEGVDQWGNHRSAWLTPKIPAVMWNTEGRKITSVTYADGTTVSWNEPREVIIAGFFRGQQDTVRIEHRKALMKSGVPVKTNLGDGYIISVHLDRDPVNNGWDYYIAVNCYDYEIEGAVTMETSK